MRPQVFLYPQQSILLSWAPWSGRGLLKYLSPLTRPAFPRQKAFSVIKYISDSGPGQSNNRHTSQCDYKALTMSFLGRCSGRAGKWKTLLWSSAPCEDEPHPGSSFATRLTSDMVSHKSSEHFLPFINNGKKKNPIYEAKREGTLGMMESDW